MKRNKKFKETFCPAPWHACFVHPNGSIRPCCTYTQPLGSIHSGDSIEAVWGSQMKEVRQQFLEGQTPKGCQQCFEKNRRGVRSRRDFFIERFSEVFKSDEEPFSLEKNSSEVPLDHLIYLDLTLSNKCNLRCRFCGPHNSSRWVNEATQLKEAAGDNFWEGLFPEVGEAKNFSKQEALHLVKQLPFLRDVDINGGEPLMTPEALELIESLAEMPNAQDIRLNLTTNGTIVPHKLKETFKSFQSVSITMSIDGVGEMYQYMRGENFRLEHEIRDSIKFYTSIENIFLTFRFTLCALNLFQLSPVLRWHEELKGSSNKIGPLSIGMVVKPRELLVTNLPSYLRKKALQNLDLKKYPHLTSIEQTLRAPGESDEGFQRFVRFVKDIDDIRGQSLKRVQPEFEDIF